MTPLSIVSPRIHNLGDFAHCLPALSAIHKNSGFKINFGICNSLKKFKGIKDLLMCQEMFESVFFMDEVQWMTQTFLIDDSGPDSENPTMSQAAHHHMNFFNSQYGANLSIDEDFELQVPYFGEMDYFEDKILIGDRWSPEECPDLDMRRQYSVLKNSGKFDGEQFKYLDYSDNLVYNCSLIKYNPNPFYTTFTGIGILSDLMKKETHVMWDDDMRMWNGKPVECDFDLHYRKNSKNSLEYIKEFNWK